jgi:hypothetical protein
MNRYTYRTFIDAPAEAERAFADALFDIMGRHVHDPADIVTELNRTGPTSPSGAPWTVEMFKSEIEQLGEYSNSIGAPVGSHSANAVSERILEE